MRMLFKWAIPWSDRVYNAFSHVKPALCRAAAQRQGTRSSLGRSGLPPRPPPGGQRGPASPPAAQDRRRNFAKSRECPQRDSSLKKQHYFAFAVKSLSLCTISFDVHRRAKIAMLIMLLFTNKIDALTILQCLCFIEQNTIWKWYLPSQLFCSTWKINQYKANQR